MPTWIFSTPAIVVQPLTGLGLVHCAGYALLSGWIFDAICLHVIAGTLAGFRSCGCRYACAISRELPIAILKH
ncbi:DUF2269 family protein [Caballeronia sp. GAWG1-5s-s]|uniref:DUF2269 family protein n=1 Tax=Caballeronia sp. GAWG1-5s-s TaxID=2921743 RepID=UPI0020294D3A|nr:DUF2269 family protein [Caballeronia sp. GAWG1-5s-s]